MEACEERCLLSAGGSGAVLAPLALSPTQTDLVPTPLPVVAGHTAFVTAVVASAGGTPTGEVVFTVDGAPQTPVALETVAGRQQATFTTSTLSVGPHTITAAYQGDVDFDPSISAAPATLQVVTVTETNVTVRVPAPVGVALSPTDGNFYVAEAGQNRIAVVNPVTLAVTESPPVPTADAAPFGLAVAPDGTVYFTEYLGNKIGKYVPSTATFTEYAVPTTDSGPWGIAVGNDGSVYFTEFFTGKIGVLNPATGVITDSLPDQFVGGAPSGIVAGPAGDNHVYFVNTEANTVGSLLATRNASGDPVSVAVIQVPLPGSDPSPLGVAVGPDGKIWYTEVNASAIGRWDQANPDPTTSVSVYDLPSANSVPLGIASGPGDGKLYYTDFTANALGAIDANTGAITQVPLTAPLAGPFGIATGPGGVWFTETIANQVGRYIVPLEPVGGIQPMGTAANSGLTEAPLPNAAGGPFGITVGSDGAVWFTESAGSALGRYVPATKAATSVPTLTPNSRPLGITSGPGGLLYFTEATGLIGSYDPATQAQAEYPIPTANSGPLAIVNCPACGNAVFFTESVANKIGRLDTTSGVVTEYPIPTANSIPYGIAVGPDGKVYSTRRTPIRSACSTRRTCRRSPSTPLPADASSPTQIVAAPDGTCTSPRRGTRSARSTLRTRRRSR
ncbi:MAG: Ig-like domain repeat protein [Isosphaeraceae bacterium]